MFYLRRGWSGGHSRIKFAPKIFLKNKIFVTLQLLTTPPKITKIPPTPLPPPPKTPGVTFFCGKGDRFHTKWPDFHDFGAFDKEGGYMAYTTKRLKNHEIRADIWECPPDHPLLRLNIGLLNLYIYFL